MSTAGTVDEAMVRHLFRALADTSWSWTETALADVVSRLGWTLSRRTERIVSADTGLALEDPFARFQVDGVGGIDVARLMLTPLRVDDPIVRAAVDDVFAAVTATATVVLGTPTRRLPGAFPEVRWRGTGASIVLRASPSAVEVEWAGTSYLEQMDKLRELEDAG
ncbi:DUF6301 family protein [Cryptosporangium arvum]|uniref:Uncharacterized protein n=1 Tax=Cryptosporangium arvum DSM 44712 TaxID=927661 RepID=A0A010ZYR4_9ACTN|nr:DUF6301 family protein [Cryptosporangium arvum]EXG82347.1 hypothetical protein CryarDRAFT_3523 [Cryptosporangium arvum DSM 44712]